MSACPSNARLTRAISERDASFLAHAEQCAECRAAVEAHARLVGLGRAIEIAAPEAAGRDRLLAIARATPQSTPRRRRWIPTAIAIGAAIAAGAAAIIFVREEPAPEVPWSPRLASVRGSEQAVYAHRVHLGQPPSGEEVVELRDDRIDISIDPLEAERTLRVKTDDSEVDLVGTNFSVAADGGELRSVTVIAGRAEIRGPAGIRSLGSGESWVKHPQAKAAPAPRGEPKAIAPAPPIAPVQSSPNAPTMAAPTAEDHFVEGMRRFKISDYEGAAREFTAATTDPTAPIAEDAEYWLAIATTKLGDTESAIDLLRAFLAAHPDSLRKSEVTSMLGHLDQTLTTKH
jgi:TolA-binding protein